MFFVVFTMEKTENGASIRDSFLETGMLVFTDALREKSRVLYEENKGLDLSVTAALIEELDRCDTILGFENRVIILDICSIYRKEVTVTSQSVRNKPVPRIFKPTFFEEHAMHCKTIACLDVKNIRISQADTVPDYWVALAREFSHDMMYFIWKIQQLLPADQPVLTIGIGAKLTAAKFNLTGSGFSFSILLGVKWSA
jgi:hypothetical protein